MRKRASLFGWPAQILAIAAVTAIIGLLALIPETAQAVTNDRGLYLDCRTTKVTEGDSFTVDLVYNGYGSSMSANWHADPGTADATDYVDPNGKELTWGGAPADGSTVRGQVTYKTIEDDVPEEDETFTVRFSPTTLVRDTDDPPSTRSARSPS